MTAKLVPLVSAEDECCSVGRATEACNRVRGYVDLNGIRYRVKLA